MYTYTYTYAAMVSICLYKPTIAVCAATFDILNT